MHQPPSAVRWTHRTFSNDIYIPIKTLQQRIGDTITTRRGASFDGEDHRAESNHVASTVSNEVKQTAEVIEDALASHKAMEDVSEWLYHWSCLNKPAPRRMMFMVFMGLVAAISLLVGGIMHYEYHAGHCDGTHA